MMKEENIIAEKETRALIVDGKEYPLKPLNINMMEVIEDKFDKPWDELISGARMGIFRYIFWICLKDNNPELTEEQLGEMVTSETLMDTYKKALT